MYISMDVMARLCGTSGSCRRNRFVAFLASQEDPMVSGACLRHRPCVGPWQVGLSNGRDY